MSKIGGPPSGPHHHHRTMQTGGQRQIKKSPKTVDPSQVQDSDAVDALDELESSRQVRSKSDAQDFGDAPAPELSPVMQDDGEGKPLSERYTLAEPHLAALLSAICAQLDALAKALDETAAPEEQRARSALALATTTHELKDILRQVMCGDYGFKPTLDPNTTLGRLFAGLKSWPGSVPPGRKPDARQAWTSAEWDAFVAWLNAPPALPSAEELF